MIVKVQRPLVGTPHAGGWPEIVVYDEHRAHKTLIYPEDLPDWLRQMLKDAPKLFAEAVWDDRAQCWRFTDMADWQPW